MQEKQTYENKHRERDARLNCFEKETATIACHASTHRIVAGAAGEAAIAHAIQTDRDSRDGPSWDAIVLRFGAFDKHKPAQARPSRSSASEGRNLECPGQIVVVARDIVTLWRRRRDRFALRLARPLLLLREKRY